MALRFGTAGIPRSTEPRDTLNGIRQVKALGLGSMELEFVRSVNISEELSPKVRKLAKSEDVLLTCHGQYYINLNSKEEKKVEASKKRIILAAERARDCGAWSLCFHAGFYQGKSKDSTYSQIKAAMEEIEQGLDGSIWLRPETTGKPTQWGDLDEILDLSQEVGRVMPCIDFSHLHARTGAYNKYEEFVSVLEKVESSLGKEGLKNMHLHLSGIDYGPKGERKHLDLEESDMNYKELLRCLKEFRASGCLICESPSIEEDALQIKKTYEVI